jgi:hypothetical protein
VLSCKTSLALNQDLILILSKEIPCHLAVILTIQQCVLELKVFARSRPILTKRIEDNLTEDERAEIRKHLAPWRQQLLKIMDKVEKEKREKEEGDRKMKKRARV